MDSLLTPEFLEKLLNQGSGFVMAMIMFIVWFKQTRGHVRRLEQILTERKTDRDAMLGMLGELKAYLARSDAFETFAREALHELESDGPKRRAMDRLLAAAVQKAATTREHP